MAAHQAPPSLGFSRQEHWSGLPIPSPMCESEVTQSCLTLSDTIDCSLPGSSIHGIFQAIVLDCHFLLQGIFPTQGSNPGLPHFLHWQADSLPLAPPGKPAEIGCLKLEKVMAPHSSTLAWQIPWMEEPGRLHGVVKRRTRLNDFAFTFHFHALEKEMATHSSVLAWRIPGTGEPGGLPSMRSHRVGHD